MPCTAPKTQEQKDTLTTIANLAGTAIGATTGQGANVVASSQAAQNAVKNNYLNHDEMVSTRDKLVACADSECRKKVYQNSKALSQKNRDDFIKTCAKNGTSPACLAKKKEIPKVIVEYHQGKFDTDGSVPEIDDMMRNLDEINLNDNTVGPALVAEQNAREAAIGYGATEKQAKELATIAAAAISIIQNKKGKGRGKPLDGSTSTVVRSSSQNAVGNTVTTQLDNVVTKGAGKYDVGPYNEIKGTVPGLDAHHAGQKAAMKKLVDGYDPNIGPSILVPKVGHTIKGPNGIVSRSTKGIGSVRDLLARDVKELRRVYSDVPNSQLKNLINLNKETYPSAFKK